MRLKKSYQKSFLANKNGTLLNPQLIKIRIRLRFKKIGDKIFISHLDLMRLFERALRRCQIPFSMSKGFNPRPKLSLPLALGLGIKGLDEILELELDEWIIPDEVTKMLRPQLPDGIEISTAEIVQPLDNARPMDVVYMVIFERSKPPDIIAIKELLDRKTINVIRSGSKGSKSVDLRPSIINITDIENGVIFHIRIKKEGMARPEEILNLLGVRLDADVIKIVRTNVNLTSL